MSENIINRAIEHITGLIKSRKLKEAIGQLGILCEQCGDWNLQTSLEQVSTSYNYMLQYLLQGFNDPERKKVYDNIIIQLLEITDRVHMYLLDTVSPTLYHILRNKKYSNLQPADLLNTIKQIESLTLDLSVNSLMPDSQKQTETSESLYQYEKELFLQTWTNTRWSKEDQEAAAYAMQAPISQVDYSMFIGAVMMSLIQCFDVNKLMWLFNVYSESKSPRIRQRAIIAIFFALHRHASRLPYYPIIGKRISLLKEDDAFARDLTQCYINYIYSRETGKITKMMNEEIVPDILRSMNNMKPASKPDTKDEDDENIPKLLFPNLEDKELEKKMEKISRMTMEGGDLYMSTFQNLKNFAFFHDIENWFKPFDMNQPAIIKLTNTSGKTASTLLSLLQGGIYLCDSDKYSIAHLLPHMPLDQFNMMSDQIKQAEEAMKEEEDKEENLDNDGKADKMENSNFMHDLYRLYKLCPRKKEFVDIFEDEIFVNESTDICQMLYETNNLLPIAELLLKKKYWKEAGRIYDMLLEWDKSEQHQGNLYERRGYTYQKMKRYSEALQCYLKAEVFVDDKWLKLQIASCYRFIGQYSDALSYYREIDDDANLNIQYNIGLCLAESRQYDEALNAFFKIYLEHPDDVQTWRAIAWYSFMADKSDQSLNFFLKIFEKNPTNTDYLNAGHLMLANKKIQEAINYYRMAIALCKDNEEFLMLFNSDIDILISKGVDADNIPLILDLI